MQDLPEGYPHGAMRRKDREIAKREEINEIICSTRVMHLALAENDVPFLVPVFFAYDGKSLYFHTSKSGTKVRILRSNNKVCFEISIYDGFIESDMACDFEAKHRTVIGMGKAIFVEDESEKIEALNMIVARFSDKQFEYPKANLNVTTVIRIDIESIKGKKHGFQLGPPRLSMTLGLIRRVMDS